MGYPWATSYKYLGIMIDDRLNLCDDLDKRKKKSECLKRQLWLIQHQKLSGNAKLQIWHSLHRAKWSYGSEILASLSETYRTWLKSTWYRALKIILGIKQNVETELLFKTCLSVPWECYIGHKHAAVLTKLAIPWKGKLCPCHESEPLILPKKLPIESCLKAKAIKVLKLKMGIVLNGWTKVKPQ